jgi:hypothetical protein
MSLLKFTNNNNNIKNNKKILVSYLVLDTPYIISSFLVKLLLKLLNYFLSN